MPNRRWFTVENCVCGAAVLTIVVLVVLPLLSLLWGSLWTGHGIGAANFARVLSERLYFDSLFNSLVLGRVDRAAQHHHRRAARLGGRSDELARTRLRETHRDARLPLAAVSGGDRLREPVQPACRRRSTRSCATSTGSSLLTFNIFSMPGLVLVTVLHTFPFVYLLASAAFASVDASYEESAQILGAGRLRTAARR